MSLNQKMGWMEKNFVLLMDERRDKMADEKKEKPEKVEKVAKKVIPKTRTGEFMREVSRRIRAGYAAIFVRTFEEIRTLNTIKECCNNLNPKEPMFVWDCTITNPEAGSTAIKSYTLTKDDPVMMVDIGNEMNIVPTFDSSKFLGKSVLCLLDFNFYIADQVGVIRSIKNHLEHLSKVGKTLIFVGPRLPIPEELEKDISILDFPLPGMEELQAVLGYAIKSATEGTPDKTVVMTDDIKYKLCEAALGLTAQEALDLFSLTLVKNHKTNIESVRTVLDGKCDVIKRDGILEYFTPEISINDIGGLNILKDWLLKRINIFTEDARDWGLPYPKGLLMVGIQGCGKSLVAKMIAHLFGIPLLRLDMGRIFQKFQGESEGNSRRSLMVAEAVAPCVLWIDEIEKGFSGTRSSGETDSGVTNRVVQTFLTWMQEKTSPVFIAATGNNVSQLPPELMRKGRIDEIFFVDLPNADERREILKIHLQKRPRVIRKGAERIVNLIPRTIENSELEKVVKASHGYTGSEIEQVIVNALFDTYKDKRDLIAEDLIQALKDMIPLAKTMDEDIKALRKWGEGRARNASAEGKYVPPDEKENPFRRVDPD
jgi:ATP-dependent 26S proteasome regulatory subunit